MRTLASLALLPVFLLGFCTPADPPPQAAVVPPFDAAFLRIPPLEAASLPLAVRFESAMGTATGALTYNAQPFRITRHLGDDLNGIGGWNSDLGDGVHAAGTGKVVYVGWPSDGWGNMVTLAHRVPDPGSPTGWTVMQAVYAHLDRASARHGEHLPRGGSLGTVGTANGRYLAHLHLEIRQSLSIYPGPGYSDHPLDRVSPEKLIREHRAAGELALLVAPERVGPDPNKGP